MSDGKYGANSYEKSSFVYRLTVKCIMTWRSLNFYRDTFLSSVLIVDSITCKSLHAYWWEIPMRRWFFGVVLLVIFHRTQSSQMNMQMCNRKIQKETRINDEKRNFFIDFRPSKLTLAQRKQILLLSFCVGFVRWVSESTIPTVIVFHPLFRSTARAPQFTMTLCAPKQF